MKVVLDTNVLVAAGFNGRSSSAVILSAAREGRLDVVWDAPTEGESRRVLEKIPPLSWNEVRDVYLPEHRFVGRTRPRAFEEVPDPADRLFAALAHAAGAVLVTNDDHLLSVRDALGLEILTPGEFVRRHLGG